MPPLFTIETPRLRLTWSGPAAASRAAEPLAVRVGETEREHDVWLEEETAYPVLVQSLDGSEVVLRHRDPVVVSGLVSADQGRALHGVVRFGSQAGRARFELLAGDVAEAAFEVSVLPTKLSPEEVRAMRSHVEAHAVGLAVSALRPTTLAAGPSDGAVSVPVWLAALDQAVGSLADALREIERRPEAGLVREVEAVLTGRIRRPSPETRRGAARSGLGPATLPARPARTTLDTPAHRWLSERLARIDRQVRALGHEEAQRRPSARRRAVIADLARLAEHVSSLRRLPALAAVSGRAPAVPPLVLRRRPAYAAAFDSLRQLERGMDLRAGGLDVATQDLAVVFETWCALAVVEAAAEALGVQAPARPFGVRAVGTDVRLGHGQKHAVRLHARGTRVEVAYNPRFPAPPALLPQRPDLVLTVHRDGRTRRVVLDAKYRRDDSASYRRRHGAAGPPEDALGTLHRYRDAIPGAVEVAAALFPGTDDEAFRASRLWTSLDALGVGAIPARPGDTAALADFIGVVVGSPDGPPAPRARRGPTR